MLGFILLTIVPSLLIYILLEKSVIVFKSNYLKFAICWFTGQYIFTILVFLLAVLLGRFTTNLIFKSTIIILLLNVTLFAVFYKTLLHITKNIHVKKLKAYIDPVNIFIILFCFLFSFFFFTPNLSYRNGAIYRSPIYWDYHWQMSLVQNFVYGDNFPPENEAFSGIPANYHYFWMVNASMYQSLGLNAVQTVNYTSIIQFFFLLITIIGLCHTYFRSRLAGFLAVTLSITSSSWHFVDYFAQHKNQNILKTITGIFTTSEHPWTASFVRNIHPFVYNGTFFNLFYLIEERQMIPGIIFMLLSLWVIAERKQFSSIALFLIGMCLGAFFLWHLHITIIVLCALTFSTIFGNDRKSTMLLLLGFLIVFLPHFVFFKKLTHTYWFLPATARFPKINFGFSDQENKSFSLMHAFYWYAYSYGLKFFLIPLGLAVLFRKRDKLSLSLAAVTLPTFILLNSIQLSPNSIYENHKFLRPMNFAIDIIVAFFVYTVFFRNKKLLFKILGTFCMLLLTLSGIMEQMAFLHSKPTVLVAKYPTPLTVSVRADSQPKSIFVTSNDYGMYLAGRKLFLASEQRGHDEDSLKIKERQKIIKKLYDYSDKSTFCFLTRRYGIDFVEYNKSNNTLPDYLDKASYFPTLDDNNNQILFIDGKKTCKS